MNPVHKQAKDPEKILLGIIAFLGAFCLGLVFSGRGLDAGAGFTASLLLGSIGVLMLLMICLLGRSKKTPRERLKGALKEKALWWLLGTGFLFLLILLKCFHKKGLFFFTEEAYFKFWILFLFVHWLGRQKGGETLFWKIWIPIAAALVGYGLEQAVFILPAWSRVEAGSLSPLFLLRAQDGAVWSVFFYSNHFGFFGALFCLLAFGLFKDGKLKILFSCLGLLAMFLSGAKGSFLALGLLFFMEVVLQSKRWTASKKLAVGLLLVLMALGIYNFVDFFPWWDSVTVRLDYAKRALELIKASPFTGCGLACFQSAQMPFLKAGEMPVRFAHNDFLQLAAEGGIFLAMLYGAFLFSLARNLVKKENSYEQGAGIDKKKAFCESAKVGNFKKEAELNEPAFFAGITVAFVCVVLSSVLYKTPFNLVPFGAITGFFFLGAMWIVSREKELELSTKTALYCLGLLFICSQGDFIFFDSHLLLWILSPVALKLFPLR